MAKKLSIVILSYNTKDILKDCLNSLAKNKDEIQKSQTIVVDNNSLDGSQDLVKKYKWIKLVENKDNLGFAKGNNSARPYCDSELVLFLNSDTVVLKDSLAQCIKFMDTNPDTSAMTCKVVLPTGKLDLDTRRSFPTPWVAFTHFTHLDRVFPKSAIFAKYWYGFRDENQAHQVEVIQGAFFLARKKVLDKVGWFDESYFLDGEDIDLCWKIAQTGGKIMYYPGTSIIHIKKASKKKSKIKSVSAGVGAMEIFYNKRLSKNYPFFINLAVKLGILGIKLVRSIKLLIF